MHQIYCLVLSRLTVGWLAVTEILKGQGAVLSGKLSATPKSVAVVLVRGGRSGDLVAAFTGHMSQPASTRQEPVVCWPQ